MGVSLEVVVAGEVRGVIQVELDCQVCVLTGLIAQRFEIDPEMRLVFQGRVLTNSQRISDLSISKESKIYVISDPLHFSVKVIKPSGEEHVCSAAKYISTEDFISDISVKLDLPLDYIAFVHSGQVIGGKFSLCHWGITKGSILRAVPIKKKTMTGPRPAQLIDELYRLVSKILTASGAAQKAILTSISSILEDKKLQAYAKLDREVKQQLDDVLMILDSAELQNTSKTDHVIAAINDLTITQFEESREGMKILEEVFLKTDEVAHMASLAKTKTDYKSKISKDPLPIWWNSSSPADGPVNVLDAERKMTMQQRFRREISALKKMGFSDETGILMALKQTSGNVPQAARILMKNVPRQC